MIPGSPPCGARGCDLVRAIDLYPQGTADAVHFEAAAKQNRVRISNDQDLEVIANRWLAGGCHLKEKR